MPWKKEKPAGESRREFSERYYQEQNADLMKENREVWDALKQSDKNTDDWKTIAKDWERVAGKWERNATQAARQMWFAMFIWPVVWIICKIAELCWR